MKIFESDWIDGYHMKNSLLLTNKQDASENLHLHAQADNFTISQIDHQQEILDNQNDNNSCYSLRKF